MFNFLIKFTESDKRVLIALLLVFILLFILVGYLAKLIKYIVKVQGDFVPKSMYDLLRTNVITDRKEFIKVSLEKNRRKLYFDARLPVLIAVISFIFLFIYQIVINNFSWAFMGHYLSEASFKFSWPTTNFFGMQIISNWPTLIKGSVLHLNEFGAWVTYIFVLTNAYTAVHFLICTCAFLARNVRTYLEANEYFNKDLKELKKLKESNAIVSQGEPSQEIKDYVNKEGKDSA